MTTAKTRTADGGPDTGPPPPGGRARGPADPMRGAALPMAVIVLGAVAGTLYGLLTPPAFEASANVLVAPDKHSSGADAVNYAQAYGRLANLPETLTWAPVPAPWGTSVESAAKRLRTSTSPDTPLIRLTATAPEPRRAATLANAAAAALVRYGTGHQADTGVRVILMSNALAPTTASSPKLLLDIAVGAASGGLLAALAALAGLRWPPASAGRRRQGRAWDTEAVPDAPSETGGRAQTRRSGASRSSRSSRRNRVERPAAEDEK
ncbi:YveK family protein [Actinomadura harenae]|uniref:Lipopolysaccharide biosynthesis protein n=1 Tax=Actinomadura harenae TaxID=2483351 RepID=A0A3M2LQ67_9ACTN|nr:lipopolysaccharide biosynthesis protein [Actinomadura harenae]RMI39634.1 lipopolysaccharide biosynthesis protein [Actinomadura harenae]